MEKRQDPEKMAGLLARRERNGWSWSELSQRSGLPTWKLQWWRRRFRRTALDEVSGEPFVAVEIVGKKPPWALSLEILAPSGHRVVVPVGFDPDHLAQVLRVLAAQC